MILILVSYRTLPRVCLRAETYVLFVIHTYIRLDQDCSLVNTSGPRAIKEQYDVKDDHNSTRAQMPFRFVSPCVTTTSDFRRATTAVSPHENLSMTPTRAQRIIRSCYHTLPLSSSLYYHRGCPTPGLGFFDRSFRAFDAKASSITTVALIPSCGTAVYVKCRYTQNRDEARMATATSDLALGVVRSSHLHTPLPATSPYRIGCRRYSSRALLTRPRRSYRRADQGLIGTRTAAAASGVQEYSLQAMPCFHPCY